jgi:hypothetical protein
VVVFASLDHPRNWHALGPVVLEEVIGGIGKTLGSLLFGGTLSNPDEDLNTAVKDEDIFGIQGFVGEGLDLDHLHLASLIGQSEELLLLFLGGIRGGGGNGLASSEVFPEFLGTGILGVILIKDGELAGTAFRLDGGSELGSLGPFHSTAFLSVHLVNVKTMIKDEDISRVKGFNLHGDLTDNDALLALNVEEAGTVFLSLDVLETGLNTTLEEFNLLEVRKEKLGFRSLNLTVLHWVSIEIIIKLNGLVGSGTILILGGFGANPEVNIIAKLLTVGVLLEGLQDDIRISSVEFAIVLLGPVNNLELLNAPDLKTNLLASTLPGILSLRSGVLNLLLKVRSEVGNVGILNIELTGLEHGFSFLFPNKV